MKRNILAVAVVMLLPLSAVAGEAETCTVHGGQLRTGVVISQPRFVHGHQEKGIELSHTRFSLKADQDGRIYDVAIDNVFANGFDKQQGQIPAPLDSIHQGDRVELCGALYTSGVGIHWVHTNCGKEPTAQAPDGWVKQLSAGGAPGPNLEGNMEYCSLFHHSRKKR